MSLWVVFALRRAALTDFPCHCYVDSVGSLSHAGNPVLLQNLGMLDRCSGAHYRILLPRERPCSLKFFFENLSQHFDYCVAVSLSPWYLPNKWTLRVIISNH